MNSMSLRILLVVATAALGYVMPAQAENYFCQQRFALCTPPGASQSHRRAPQRGLPPGFAPWLAGTPYGTPLVRPSVHPAAGLLAKSATG